LVANAGTDDEFLQAIRKDAEKGDPVSQAWLGDLYAKGEGAPGDDATAIKWLRLASDKGSTEAQQKLGFQYFQGRGVPQNYVVAYLWMNAAAVATSGASQQAALRNRDMVAAKMTAAQRAEAQRLLQASALKLSRTAPSRP
jgi:TPR repeat protein